MSSETKKINSGIGKDEMIIVGMMIKRFGKDQVIDILLKEHDFEARKLIFLKRASDNLMNISEASTHFTHSDVNKAIDVTMDEYFKGLSDKEQLRAG